MRKSLAAVISIPFVAFVFVACSGDDSGNPDGSTDATAKDVVVDKKPLPEAAPTDGGGGCEPSATIDTSQITWVPPLTPNPTACSAAQVTGYYNACLGTTATSTTCQNFTNTAGNATCEACLITPDTASAYGALIAIGGVDYANISGCVAILTGDTTNAGCGAKLQAVTDCETAACQANCPTVTDQTSFTEYTNCTEAADSAVCESYINMECNLQDAGVDGAASAYTTCENHTSFEDYYNSMATVFCGNYAVTDAGTDASTDAATEASVDASNDAPDGD
jgi:hypothetical protein